MIAGSFLFFGDGLILALLAVAVPTCLFAARGEERELRSKYGLEYTAYRDRFRLGKRRGLTRP